MRVRSCALSPESWRCVLFLGVIFIMLNDFTAAVWSVKGNHNKCWGFSMAALLVAQQWIMIKALCCVDLGFDPAAIWLTFKWGLATVIHTSTHSGLNTNIELSWKGHFESPFIIWVDTPIHAKSSGFSLYLKTRGRCRLSLCFQVELFHSSDLIEIPLKKKNLYRCHNLKMVYRTGQYKITHTK